MKPSTQRKKAKAEEADKKLKKNKRDTSCAPIPRPNSGLVKYVTVLNAAYTVSTTATFVLLNGVASGNEIYQRTNRVTIGKQLKLSYFFTQSTSTVKWYAADAPRIIIVWDTQGDATPSASDILLDIDAAGTTSTSNLSHRNTSNKDRFIYLYDKRFHLPSYNVTTVGAVASTTSGHLPNSESWVQDVNIKLDGLITRFDGTGSTISSIGSGALYFFMLGGLAAANAGWTATVIGRYTYYDH